MESHDDEITIIMTNIQNNNETTISIRHTCDNSTDKSLEIRNSTQCPPGDREICTRLLQLDI